MAKGVLSDESKRLIQYLMANEKIAAKVKAAGGQEKSYAIYSIEDCGTIILGETKYRFINRLFNCQFPLTFVQFASAVWDALVDFSVVILVILDVPYILKLAADMKKYVVILVILDIPYISSTR